MSKKLNLAGLRFERLLAISEAGKASCGATRWMCKCDCGNTVLVRTSSLKSGKTKSCGCLHNELASIALRKGSDHPLRDANLVSSRTHGESRTKEYRIWTHMIGRCHNKNDAAYNNYGGRGIYVCDRWRNSFENFIEDMGRPMPGQSIDRIDNNGPYSKENCRWATRKQQSRNTRRNVVLEYKGRSLTVVEWSEVTGINAACISKRIKSGWTAKRALETPKKSSVGITS